jgi:DNA-binding response OmpR family regulator
MAGLRRKRTASSTMTMQNLQAGGIVGDNDQIARPRILIVEDEPLIALMLADMLGELEFEVAANVAQVADALAVLAEMTVDIALLDVNIGTQKIDPVADLLAARGTPFIFTTGYGNAGVPANYAGRAILQKPFHIEGLIAVLRSELANKSR